MIDHTSLDDIASKISSLLPDDLQLLQSDIENNIRAILESSLKRMNLVSREEFDVQTALLSRTREKLEQLELQITQLEQN